MAQGSEAEVDAFGQKAAAAIAQAATGTTSSAAAGATILSPVTVTATRNPISTWPTI